MSKDNYWILGLHVFFSVWWHYIDASYDSVTLIGRAIPKVNLLFPYGHRQMLSDWWIFVGRGIPTIIFHFHTSVDMHFLVLSDGWILLTCTCAVCGSMHSNEVL